MATSESYISRAHAAETLARSREYRRSILRESLRRIALIFEISADFLAGAISIVVAYALQLNMQGHVELSLHRLVAATLLYAVFIVLLLWRDGAYGDRVCLLRVRETERAIRVSIQSLILLLLVSFTFRLNFSGTTFLICLGLAPAFLVIQKQLVISFVGVFQRRIHTANQMAVYRKSDEEKQVTSRLPYTPELEIGQLDVIRKEGGRSNDLMFQLEYRRWQSTPRQDSPIAVDLLKPLRPDLLIVATSDAPADLLPQDGDMTDQPEAAVTFPPGQSAGASQWSESLPGGGATLTAPMERNDSWHYALVKRGIDIAISSVLLVLLLPLLASIALLIRLTSPGPALFIQKRVGRNGKVFDMYKFRSMFTNSPTYHVSPTHSSDPRITRLGRVLRRTSVDELPQLMNVFLGNMSLVGPRPEMSFIVERYTPEQRRRLGVLPGITGLWQLSVSRAFPIHENIEYDLYYMGNKNIFLDVAILIHTAFCAARGGV